MTYRELCVDHAQQKARGAIERLATTRAYCEASDRLRHMVNYDHDLEVVAKKTPAERHAILLDSIKDFNTFLESYVVQAEIYAEDQVKRDYP